MRLKVDLIVTFFTPPLWRLSRPPRDPNRDGGRGRSGRNRSRHEPRPAGWQPHRTIEWRAEVAGKNLELIRELIPAVRRVGVLADDSDPFAKTYVAQISQAARSAGMEVEPVITRPGQPLEPVFDTLTGKRVGGLIIQGSIAHKEMLDLAIKYRLPALTSTRLGPSLGALISYGSDYLALARQSATYVDKILKGAKPADLPVAFPTKFLLIINQKPPTRLVLRCRRRFSTAPTR